MSRKKTQLRFASYIISLLCVAWSPYLLSQTITIANQTWLPFAGESLVAEGLLSQITRAAFATQNITVKYEFMPYDEALVKAKAGEIDGLAAWTQLNQWSDDLLYSDPILKHNLVIYKRIYSQLETEPVSKLYNKRIGVQRNFRYTKLLKTLLDKGRLVPVYSDSSKDSFYKLLTGEVDFCVDTYLGGQATLNQHYSKSERGALMHVDSEFSMAPSYLIISKATPYGQALLIKLNDGLKAIRENGTYDNLLKTFIEK